ncbi:ATP-binding cassette, subfamily B [Pedobacter westerhofensis]|uniref:ATP-binding cassette, subfamily B n=1 Tax=Pedobacter westerhofensis TaxID=425512 RepID=A0A521CZV3_9SPHI|nr:peptidase domain-containing ABC transporter [Pedobacter westerhofensis]SMO64969.1 ATP-binding cassette, subfamily B [Pedobacter westerhofensis]
MRNFPHYSQFDSIDCGPGCLQIISKFYGREYSLNLLRSLSNVGREGVSVLGICRAAEKLGFNSTPVKISFADFASRVQLPCIVHWQQNHFLVVYKITSKYVYLSDPGSSRQKVTVAAFLKNWISDVEDNEKIGIVIALEMLPAFKTINLEDSNIPQANKTEGLKYLFEHLFSHKKVIIQIAFGLFFSTLFTLILPFLTQGIIDSGINEKDINFIYLLVFGQIAIYTGQLVIEFIQNWLLMYVGSRINVTMVSEFLSKIMAMPIKYFDTKLSGDLLQRIDDHKRIEKFLTSKTLGLIFQVLLFAAFVTVLAFYNTSVFVCFMIGTSGYIGWVLLFHRKRRIVDFQKFIELSKNQSKQIEIINGMQDIKLHNSERQKRWEWQEIQARLFDINLRYLSLEQYQRLGAKFINSIKNIIITLIATKAVIAGDMSLGQLIAIQFIVGELNSPLSSAIDFIQSYQEAKISLDRIGEMQQPQSDSSSLTDHLLRPLSSGSLQLIKVSFTYAGTHYSKVLKDVDLHIPEGKTTAIVGLSGSGKTTLLKLLMKFYEPTEGQIVVGDINLKSVNEQIWREKCGSVLQDGFVFSDTIARNIALGVENIDHRQLFEAAKIANIREFIDSLPLGFNTKIGPEGIGISQGQRQRLLIARAVYKNPDYIFFDEATNALDANNEKVIIRNLDDFFKGRTVVVVAHRLSTVINADKIYVLENGSVVESGSHRELIDKSGAYFTLIKNQLELGN